MHFIDFKVASTIMLHRLMPKHRPLRAHPETDFRSLHTTTASKATDHKWNPQPSLKSQLKSNNPRNSTLDQAMDLLGSRQILGLRSMLVTLCQPVSSSLMKTAEFRQIPTLSICPGPSRCRFEIFIKKNTIFFICSP